MAGNAQLHTGPAGAAPALEMTEEALQLLRRVPADGWTRYLLGVVPFLLVLLAFLSDMSTGYAGGRCAAESLGCTLAFIWNSVWKARFAGMLARTLVSEDAATKRSGYAQCIFVQLVFQSLKLVVFPLALVSVFPLAWSWAFFRTINLEADRPVGELGAAASRSMKHASAFPRSTWGALLLILAMGLVVFINVFVLLLLLPHLTKIFTGYENQWTRNTGSLFNFNLFAIASALTWFLIDPVVQSYFAVHSFYSEARTNGRDLRTRLRRLAGVILVGAAFLSALPGPLRAAARQASSPPFTRASSRPLSNDEFDHAVATALRSDEFEWVRERSAPAARNSFFERISRDLESAIDRLHGWISALRDAIRRLMPGSQPPPNRKQDRVELLHVEGWMYSIAGVILLALLFALVRRRTRSPSCVIEETGFSPPDLTSDQTIATDMPDSECLRIAREYLANGEVRLAVRAMYLANLAYLGARQLISIQQSKSNGIYERELKARVRVGVLAAAFAAANRIYERVWYGFHEVTPDLVEDFERTMEVIRRAEA